jgi:hypothetical protein
MSKTPVNNKKVVYRRDSEIAENGKLNLRGLGVSAVQKTLYALFSYIYHLEKLSKNIMRIMRARRGFGMELYAQHRSVFHSQSFERVIVQTLVSDFYFSRI